MSSGLGGSAIDAAPVITKLNSIWELNLNQVRMEEIGAMVGADVPQAIRSRTCYAEGYGDVIKEEFVLDPIHICIAIPNEYLNNMNGQKIAFLYKEIDKIDRTPVSEQVMLTALRTGRWEYITQAMHNDFESIAFKLQPELKSIKRKIMECGALGALLAGAGGAVFGLFDDRSAVTDVVEALTIDKSIKMIVQKETI